MGRLTEEMKERKIKAGECAKITQEWIKESINLKKKISTWLCWTLDYQGYRVWTY